MSILVVSGDEGGYDDLGAMGCDSAGWIDAGDLLQSLFLWSGGAVVVRDGGGYTGGLAGIRYDPDCAGARRGDGLDDGELCL